MFKLSALLIISAFVAACGPAAAPSPAPTGTPVATTPAPTATPTPIVTLAPTGTPASTTPTATASTVPTASPSAGATLQLAETSLGVIVVDAEGMTLYGFTPDVAAGEPTCTGGCADTWPPLTVAEGGFSVGSGLDETMFTLAEREDGSQQLQFGDYPLYYYAPDANPGDVGGQTLADKWYVLGADGQLNMTAP